MVPSQQHDVSETRDAVEEELFFLCQQWHGCSSIGADRGSEVAATAQHLYCSAEKQIPFVAAISEGFQRGVEGGVGVWGGGKEECF